MLSQVSNLDDIPLCRCLNIILVQGGAFPSSFLPIIFLRRHKTTTYNTSNIPQVGSCEPQNFEAHS